MRRALQITENEAMNIQTHTLVLTGHEERQNSAHRCNVRQKGGDAYVLLPPGTGHQSNKTAQPKAGK